MRTGFYVNIKVSFDVVNILGKGLQSHVVRVGLIYKNISSCCPKWQCHFAFLPTT